MRRAARGLRVLGQEAVAQFKPATKFKNALESADAPAPKFFELGAEGAALFSDSIKASKDSNKYGAAVFAGNVRKFPHIADTDGAACADKDKTEAGFKTVSFFHSSFLRFPIIAAG